MFDIKGGSYSSTYSSSSNIGHSHPPESISIVDTKTMIKTARKKQPVASSSSLGSHDSTPRCKQQQIDINNNPAMKYLPFRPQDVLGTSIQGYLTNYEKEEISNYHEIYYIGKRNIKKLDPKRPFQIPTGVGCKVSEYDDIDGFYLPIKHDHIGYRYEILGEIGKGTFGVVLEAYDHKHNCDVALKVIRNQQRFHTQSWEEIKILKTIMEVDPDDKFNVVRMYNYFLFRHHPCIVFELLSINLYEVTKKNSFKGFSIPLIRRFAFSIVKCLHALSKYDIIHCDLKPENVVLKQYNRSGIKVIDFGSSCFANKTIHTYIQSRFYRSPEVILHAKYGPQIDMWSLGCILAELYLGGPLFEGENEGDQLVCMMEVLNVPPTRFLNKCKRQTVKKYFNDRGHPIHCSSTYGDNDQFTPVESRSPRGKIRLPPGCRELLKGCDDNLFKDFLKKCLVWDPSERMTPSGAFKHAWLLKRTNDET